MTTNRVVGYTAGVFDLFHVGHLNVLRNARSMCDHLIVGVSTDELVLEYKGKRPVIPFLERCEIVRHIQFTDTVVAQESMDKIRTWEMLKFDIMFVGDDWFGTGKWKEIEAAFEQRGVRIVYFPYTRGVSSSKINEIILQHRSK